MNSITASTYGVLWLIDLRVIFKLTKRNAFKNADRGLSFARASGRGSQWWGSCSFRSSTLISLCPSSRTGISIVTGGSISSSSIIVSKVRKDVTRLGLCFTSHPSSRSSRKSTVRIAQSGSKYVSVCEVKLKGSERRWDGWRGLRCKGLVRTTRLKDG